MNKIPRGQAYGYRRFRAVLKCKRGRHCILVDNNNILGMVVMVSDEDMQEEYFVKWINGNETSRCPGINTLMKFLPLAEFYLIKIK